MTPEDLEKLSEELDECSPVTLRGSRRVETHGFHMFTHPDHQNVFAKIGLSSKGRWLIVWVYLVEERIVILTAREATEQEIKLEKREL